jgi:hypothetical protein
MKMMRIVIEADYREINVLEQMLRDVVALAKKGQQYENEPSFGIHAKGRYEYHLDFIEKEPYTEKEIDGVIHYIIKSKV